MKVEVIKCDGCGKLIEDRKEAYHLRLEGEEFFVVDGYEKLTKDLHFCWRCAQNIKSSLEKIAGGKE